MYKDTINPQAMRSMKRMVNGMFKLMGQEKFEDITILQMCQESQVARKTFYRNFEAKEDVLDYALDQLMQGYSKYMNLKKEELTLEKEICACYSYCMRNKKVLMLLYQNDLLHLLTKKLTDYLRETGCREEPEAISAGGEMAVYFEQFVASTITGVLTLWVQRGFKEDVRQLEDFTIRMLGRE